MRFIHWTLLFALIFTSSLLAAGNPPYPAAPTSNVVDNFHGTKVPDTYLPLENADAPETQKWVAEQNKLTAEFVAGKQRDQIKQELTNLWNFPRYAPPDKEGNHYFYWRNSGLEGQSVLYNSQLLHGDGQVLLDPNQLSKDGTVAVGVIAYTYDGTRLAYGLSSSGSDRQTIHIMDVDSKAIHEDAIKWSKFTNIAWQHDGSGFFYNRFPEPGSVPPAELNSHCTIHWHKLGTPQDSDPLILQLPEDPKLFLFPFMTDDGRYLGVNINEGTSPKNRFWYRPATVDPAKPGAFTKLLDAADAAYNFIDNVGDTFYFQTDADASRGKIIAIDINHPEKANWKTIIPETSDSLTSANLIHGQLVLSYLHDASTILRLANLNGSNPHNIPLPTFGTADDITGKQHDAEMFFSFSSYGYPRTVFRYDFTTEKLEVYRKSELKADVSNYETHQIFATSKDGTRVPVFLTYKKGLKLNGSNPTLLYGYGGFDVNETPEFAISRLIWLERDGIYADAVLRGGGEYGESWHEAGMLANKQHVFDDFQAAGQWLVDNHYSSPKKLAIQGGSNGGLLTAACMLQRPDLYGAVISQVPVTDMLRYPKFAAGVAWIPEYGDARADPATFAYLQKYSPLQNVKPGTVYPPVLVTTADTDDRVDPSHAKKFIATLQAASPPNGNPILLRIETKAGHGGGKPTSKIIDELSDEYAFLFRVLGMNGN